MRAELIPRPVANNPDLLKILASTAFTTVGLKELPTALCSYLVLHIWPRPLSLLWPC